MRISDLSFKCLLLTYVAQVEDFSFNFHVYLYIVISARMIILLQIVVDSEYQLICVPAFQIGMG